MPRTPLFADVQRALMLAAHFEQARTPTTEGLEQIEEARWNRRRFLKKATAATMGVVAGGSLLQPQGRAATDPVVVIVGAGVAGLTCAYRLQQYGVDAVVIEASTRVGGRMFTLRSFFPDNQTAELGGEFIDSDHKAIQRLAKDLGLTLMDLRYTDGPNGYAYYFEQRLIPADADLIEAFRPVAKQIVYDLEHVERSKLDHQSIAQWLDKPDFSRLIRSLLRVAYIGEYGLEAEEQSALNLLDEAGTVPDTFELYGDSDERFHIAEGNDAVPARLAQRLTQSIQFNTRLEAIRSEGAGYRLVVKRGDTRAEIKADVVVLALPFTMLRDKRVEFRVPLPEAKRRAIEELGYGTNAKLMAGFSGRVWQKGPISDEQCRFDRNLTGSIISDLEFQSCWETSRGQAGTHGILTNFGGGRYGRDLCQGTLQGRAGQFLNQVELVFPGCKAAYTGKVVRQHWPSSPFVSGSYTCYRPGQFTTLAGAVATPVGNLVFAGEHTSVRFNGYMEGAVESGERAAMEVLARVEGRQGRALEPPASVISHQSSVIDAN